MPENEKKCFVFNEILEPTYRQVINSGHGHSTQLHNGVLEISRFVPINDDPKITEGGDIQAFKHRPESIGTLHLGIITLVLHLRLGPRRPKFESGRGRKVSTIF